MYEGFHPQLLEEARATANLTDSTVSDVLPDIIRKWKSLNLPTLIGDFRRPPLMESYDLFQRVKV